MQIQFVHTMAYENDMQTIEELVQIIKSSNGSGDSTSSLVNVRGEGNIKGNEFNIRDLGGNYGLLDIQDNPKFLNNKFNYDRIEIFDSNTEEAIDRLQDLYEITEQSPAEPSEFSDRISNILDWFEQHSPTVHQILSSLNIVRIAIS